MGKFSGEIIQVSYAMLDHLNENPWVIASSDCVIMIWDHDLQTVIDEDQSGKIGTEFSKFVPKFESSGNLLYLLK